MGNIRRKFDPYLIGGVAAFVLSLVGVNDYYTEGSVLYTLLVSILLFKVGSGLFLLALVLLAVLWHKQRSMLYQPCPAGMMDTKLLSGNPEGFQSPGESCWRLPFQDCRVKGSDGVEVAFWFIHQKKSNEKFTWIFFHGNAGNIGHRLENLSSVYHKLGVNVVALDYRGYGNSEDAPITEAGMIRDAEAVYQWCLDSPDINSDKIILFGRSLGGAVAAALVHRNIGKKPFSGIILENTFVSTASMAGAIFPAIKRLVEVSAVEYLLVKDKWQTKRKITEVMRSLDATTTPFCFLSGSRDEIVPRSQMEDLYATVCQERKKAEKQIDTFDSFQAGHNDTPQRGGEAYWQALKLFHSRL